SGEKQSEDLTGQWHCGAHRLGGFCEESGSKRKRVQTAVWELGGFSHGRGLAAEQINRFSQDRVVVDTQRERGRAVTRSLHHPTILRLRGFIRGAGHFDRRLHACLLQGLPRGIVIKSGGEDERAAIFQRNHALLGGAAEGVLADGGRGAVLRQRGS